MQPTVWPHWLDDVWAKSPNKGEERGESLAQHTWFVLSRLADLQRLRPELPHLVGVPKLWHYLFWTCLLHDFGKAAQGFQAMLRRGDRWRQRHEVLSLAFVDWLAAELSEDEQRWIIAGIVSHHRDARTILEELYHDRADPDPLIGMVSELAPDVVDGLWRWLDECGTDWIANLGLTEAQVTTMPLLEHTAAVAHIEQQGAQRIRMRLQQYRRFVTKLSQPASESFITFLTLLRGLTTSADHMASAHLDKLPAPIQEPWLQFAQRILTHIRRTKPDADLYAHQHASAAAAGQSVVLIAPTGSAKTESALFWALGDGSAPVPRLFYALPYQASMNAMFDRLRDPARGFGDETVGLQHGRALQAVYARLMNSETWSAQAANAAKWQRNINTLNARPIKVFSPYQMLKALFQIRGFEAMLTDYAQAAFIFDEIHAYEPERLALILTLVKLLREQYGARFFVMSATFPSLIRTKLQHALGDYITIQADHAVFEAFTRHRLHLLDGDLLDGLDAVAKDVCDGKQVLVCVNTVRRAQEVQRRLQELGFAPDTEECEGDLLLIHSRFVVRDRTKLEEKVLTRSALHATDRQPFVLIATQVVEVSLNIDLDRIYSDPAPLEALLQRFGRVNRACAKGICPVHVFREPRDGQGVYGRNKDADKAGHIVRVTLAELEKHAGRVIDEAKINDWLDAIYADPDVRQEWEAAHDRVAAQAAGLARSLTPFDSNDQKEDQFEKLFDGVDVLPKSLEAEYLECLSKHEYIAASQLFVSISKQRYARFRREGKVHPVEDPEGLLKGNRWRIDLPYSAISGLEFDAPLTDADWS